MDQMSGNPSRIRTLLTNRNRSLERDFAALATTIANAKVPPLLQPYQRRLRDECHRSKSVVLSNLKRLQLNHDSILEEIISDTQLATVNCRIISERMTSPVLRTSPTDLLALKVIQWIHESHPDTRNIPPAVAEGGVAVLPLLKIAPLYLVPHLVQGSLLHLPLYFHEFGHVLYKLHKPEMDDLVRELQERIGDGLKPKSRRNDRHAEAQAAHQRKVIGAWYKWAQELFCDAVGLQMGGPSYLHAFSTYCGVLGHGDFHLPPENLSKSNHPVTWLRIRFLARRAKSLGLLKDAELIEQEWSVVADTLGVTEDYHGFYGEVVEEVVEKIISDMLIEAAPRTFTLEEIAGNAEWHAEVSPVHLFNSARRVAYDLQDEYEQWEAKAREAYLCQSQLATSHQQH